MNDEQMEVTIISGDLETVGSVIEIPHSVSKLGIGPVYEVDPKSRRCKTTLQRFEITAINDSGLELKPVPRT